MGKRILYEEQRVRARADGKRPAKKTLKWLRENGTRYVPKPEKEEPKYRRPSKEDVPKVRFWEFEGWQILSPEMEAAWLEDRRLYVRIAAHEWIDGEPVGDYLKVAHFGCPWRFRKQIREAVESCEDLLRMPMRLLKKLCVCRWAEGGLVHELLESRINTCRDPRYESVFNGAEDLGIFLPEFMVLDPTHRRNVVGGFARTTRHRRTEEEIES